LTPHPLSERCKPASSMADDGFEAFIPPAAPSAAQWPTEVSSLLSAFAICNANVPVGWNRYFQLSSAFDDTKIPLPQLGRRKLRIFGNSRRIRHGLVAHHPISTLGHRVPPDHS